MGHTSLRDAVHLPENSTGATAGTVDRRGVGWFAVIGNRLQPGYLRYGKLRCVRLITECETPTAYREEIEVGAYS